ncbi:MAG: GNAT family N-acetyltransferase [Pseudodesulfovibrio sp.]
MKEVKVMEDGSLADSAPMFSLSVKIPYDLQFVESALGWVTGLSGLAGASRKESDALRLSCEETLTYLINSYPEAERLEQISTDFMLLPGGLVEIVIANAGPPVHLSRIPLYVPQAPEESQMDGLWYFLARGAVDDFTFTNQGFDGWRAVMHKRLAEPSFTPKPSAKDQSAQPDRKVTFSTRIATPDDAADLVDLVYDTYRYTYPSEEFYYEPKLRQALENGGIVSIVVEADGVVVGNSSLILSAQTPRCAYSCSLMVRRSFRRSRAIIHLINEVDRFLASGGMDVDVCYASVVTTHTGSQKAGAKIGFAPLALIPSGLPSVEFRDMRPINLDRESGAITVRLTAPFRVQTLYMPERHHAVMAPLLSQCGLQCSLKADAEPPAATRSQFVVQENLAEGNATVMAVQLGRDLLPRLQKKIFALRAGGIKTVLVLIPAWKPIPPDLDREMGWLQAIFSGVKPVSALECYLVYTSVCLQVDFARILLSDALAVDLKHHCARLYDELFAEGQE